MHSTQTNTLCSSPRFSPAEKLGSIGAEGTEILSKSISTFFETAILMIYSHGGDVIKFCGDALMCIFEPQEASEENDAHTHTHHHNHNDGRKAAALLGEVRMGKKPTPQQLQRTGALMH